MNEQEMFDKAYRGLASQGWHRCMADGPGVQCAYSDSQGRHCAWGWVDPEASGDSDVYGTFTEITRALDARGLAFASELQWAHDNGKTPERMQANFRGVAAQYNLEIPNDEV